MSTPGPAPKQKPYHMAKFVDADGNVSPLCADFFRAVNLEGALWTNRAEAVTCRKCKRRIKEAKDNTRGHRMPQDFYDYDEANKHKRLWSGVLARAIWVDDAGRDDIAVIHWMGGAYKVVGRYSSHAMDGMDSAKRYAEECSKAGYCPTTPVDLSDAEFEAARKKDSK